MKYVDFQVVKVNNKVGCKQNFYFRMGWRKGVNALIIGVLGVICNPRTEALGYGNDTP